MILIKSVIIITNALFNVLTEIEVKYTYKQLEKFSIGK